MLCHRCVPFPVINKAFSFPHLPFPMTRRRVCPCLPFSYHDTALCLFLPFPACYDTTALVINCVPFPINTTKRHFMSVSFVSCYNTASLTRFLPFPAVYGDTVFVARPSVFDDNAPKQKKVALRNKIKLNSRLRSSNLVFSLGPRADNSSLNHLLPLFSASPSGRQRYRNQATTE